MKTHTPGPWEVDGWNGTLRGEHEPVGHVGTHVGVWAGEDTLVCTTGMMGDPESEADARLIASAPALLDALDCILRAHESGNNGAVMGEAILCEYFATKARAAILAATGGA